MKLSDAIRKGLKRYSSLTCTTELYLRWDGNELVSACSAGFGYLADHEPPMPEINMFNPDDQDALVRIEGAICKALEESFPFAYARLFTCPLARCRDNAKGRQVNGIVLVTHLNDIHGWTPEAIANYLEEQGL